MAADLTITAGDVAVLEMIHKVSGLSSVALAAGQFARLNTSTGLWEKGNATAAGELLAGGMVAEVNGFAVTILRVGTVDIGEAMASLAFGDLVYVSDTDGLFNDTAGTVTVIAGYVDAILGTDGVTPDRVLRLAIMPGTNP